MVNKRIVAFGDCHDSSFGDYATLGLRVRRLNKKDELAYVVFLGDIDSHDDFFRFLNFKEDLDGDGIIFHYVMGNHEQAWIDYITGEDDNNVIGPNDLRIKNNEHKCIEDYLKSFDSHENDCHMDLSNNIIYYHALPLGDPVSGHHSDVKRYRGRDHRFIHDFLWHYTFNKGGVIRDDVLNDNFDWMNYSDIDVMIKGHEHRNNIFNRDDRVLNIKTSGSRYVISKPCIIGVGAFSNGWFAELELESLPDSGLRAVTFKNVGNY